MDTKCAAQLVPRMPEGMGLYEGRGPEAGLSPLEPGDQGGGGGGREGCVTLS